MALSEKQLESIKSQEGYLAGLRRAKEFVDYRAYHQLVPENFPDVPDPIGQFIINAMAQHAVQALGVDFLMREANVPDRKWVEVMHQGRLFLRRAENIIIDRFPTIVQLPKLDEKTEEEIKLRGYWPGDPFHKNLALLEDIGAPEAMDPDTNPAARIIPPRKLARRQLFAAEQDIHLWEKLDGTLTHLVSKLKGRKAGLIPTETGENQHQDLLKLTDEEIDALEGRYRRVIEREQVVSLDQMVDLFDKLVRQTDGQLPFPDLKALTE